MAWKTLQETKLKSKSNVLKDKENLKMFSQQTCLLGTTLFVPSFFVMPVELYYLWDVIKDDTIFRDKT